jgi:predicted AAA+ superfamily ATPase
MQDLFELSMRIVKQKNRPFRRYLLNSANFETPLTVVQGQRGVGKTTLLVQYLLSRHGSPASEAMLYIPLDHFIIGNRTMYEIAESFEMVGGKTICFDEIHKYPEWSKHLKSINDSLPGLQVLASGSSALEIQRGTHDLSRRSVVLTLRSMSFREWLCIRNVCDVSRITLDSVLSNHRDMCSAISEDLRNQGTTVLKEFAEYLSVGYYPYSLEHGGNSDLFHLTLEQSVHATLENDLPAIFPTITGGSIAKIKRLLATICGLVPFTPDMQRIKRTLGIGDERTLKTYLKHLEDAGIIRTLHRQGGSLNTLDKPEKIYLDNPNLMRALSGSPGDKGNVRETFFLSCFEKGMVTYPDRGDFSVEGKTIEVGGKNKGFKQIANLPNSYLAIDDVEVGQGSKIPLWIFGFLY